MIKKIIFLIACIFLFAINYNNESFAYTDEDQDVEISFVVPTGMFNNMIYSSVDNDALYWVIDKTTFESRQYWYIRDVQYAEWMQPIDTTNPTTSQFYHYLDLANNYIIFNIKDYQVVYMADWWQGRRLKIMTNQVDNYAYNTNGAVSLGNVYSSGLTIQGLINNLQLLNLTLQLNNEIYFENGFDSGSAFGYDMGYQEGYDIGVIDGTTDGQLQIWQNGYDKGEADGIKLGEASGYDSGFVDGVLQTYEGGFEGYPYSQLSMLTDNTSYPYYLGIYASDSTIAEDAFLQGRLYERNNPLMFSWIRGLFVAMGAFLGIEILPSITIGLIVSIPLLFSLVMYFIKLFRGS